ncbi:hypothetical protein [Streptomyces longispororuber]|uniref:hypothetical protein n=1 Tax=Streptomyces longispororuber TaxID=68230 RepID=UPI0021098E16|nr:hypothetical protein [Streptomyces longispororuber]MCQ4207184.1 hypothetical protein [Streptomyces longispororuber]
MADHDTAPPTTVTEPRLATRARGGRRRHPWHVLVAAPLAVAGLVALTVTGNALRPFDRIDVIDAKMASKSDYFKDPEVQRLLLKHGIRVDIHRLGSRGIAEQSFEGMDVVFPSGQPAAKLVMAREQRSVRSARPFVTPLVLGTFRDYAQTLVRAGVATPQKAPGGGPTLYYDLRMDAFLERIEARRTWNDIGYDQVARGRSNSGRVLVRTSSVCESNAAGTYLSLVAFVRNGNQAPGTQPRTRPEAAGDPVLAVADDIKPLINLQGMAADEQADSYFSDEGENIAPVSVIYEHQYLAHQVAHQRRHHEQDTSRVLLYPTPQALTEPELIAIDDRGNELTDLMESDPELRRRAIELGFRVRFSGEDGTSAQLNDYLRSRGIQVPTPNPDRTKVDAPDLDSLERIINRVGNCPLVQKETQE